MDDLAENVHDGLMTFATIFTALRALVLYLVLRAVVYLLPSTMFKRPASELPPKAA